MFIAGVPMGVLPGVRTGVLPPIWLAGVSSHRDFLLLAPGVGVSPMESPPLSVRGVSAHPLPCPGVSKITQNIFWESWTAYVPTIVKIELDIDNVCVSTWINNYEINKNIRKVQIFFSEYWKVITKKEDFILWKSISRSHWILAKIKY